ncbi:unnamed protein product [Leuciscus chuanchicus]
MIYLCSRLRVKSGLVLILMLLFEQTAAIWPLCVLTGRAGVSCTAKFCVPPQPPQKDKQQTVHTHPTSTTIKYICLPFPAMCYRLTTVGKKKKKRLADEESVPDRPLLKCVTFPWWEHENRFSTIARSPCPASNHGSRCCRSPLPLTSQRPRAAPHSKEGPPQFLFIPTELACSSKGAIQQTAGNAGDVVLKRSPSDFAIVPFHSSIECVSNLLSTHRDEETRCPSDTETWRTDKTTAESEQIQRQRKERDQPRRPHAEIHLGGKDSRKHAGSAETESLISSRHDHN